jgi:hypothetical protein
MRQVSETIVNAFVNGKAKKQGNSQTDGQSLYLFGNKIAEWRKDGLYISNGGYNATDRHGNELTGSKTTKDRLNSLPGVNINQSKCKWYLNGNEWNGEWIKIDGITPPEIDTKNVGKVFDLSRKYVKTDGWRGYEQPNFAVCGANDTGSWSDSPCPSNISASELTQAKKALNGIPSKLITCETSNVFCVHHYLIVPPVHFEAAKNKVKEFINNTETRLLYACNS